MVKFTQRFERHKEVIKAVYLPRKLHLTIFYDEEFDEDVVRRIILREIDRANLQRSVDTLSFYPETKETRFLMKKIRYWKGQKVARYSNSNGFYDEKLSRILGKPPRFRYSKKFLNAVHK